MATARDADVPPPVLVYGDPRLRRPCREVGVDEDVTALVAAMHASMAAHEGVGLAAPQVGDPRRVVLVGDPREPQAAPRVLVNPRVERRFGDDTTFEEGCLSFPDLFLWLSRPRGVEVSCRDLAGNPRVLRDEGLIARILQHEIDHLDGVLFIDHLPRWRRWLLQARLWRMSRRGRSVRKECA